MTLISDVIEAARQHPVGTHTISARLGVGHAAAYSAVLRAVAESRMVEHVATQCPACGRTAHLRNLDEAPPGSLRCGSCNYQFTAGSAATELLYQAR
jgi:ribosomal protein L37AE/L43A